MSHSSTTGATCQQIQEDIDLYQSILNSLEDEKDCHDEKQHYIETLEALKKRLKVAMVEDSSSLDETMSPSINTTLACKSLHGSKPDDQNSANSSMPPPKMSLPSRKRDRSSFDNDEMSGQPLPKSRRTTPTDSPTMSAADSIDSDYFNDPTLGNLLGEDWRDDVRSNKKYLKELEEKKRQQDEDEQLARRLQEEWSQQSAPVFEPQPFRPTASVFPMSQSFLRPDGSYHMPASQSSNVSNEAIINRDDNTASPAISLSSSDEDLAFLSASEFNSRFPFSTAPPRVLPPSFGTPNQMPGTFPGSGVSTYTSRPGASVYAGNNSVSSYNQSISSFGPGRSSFGLNGVGSQWNPGSAFNPFDLDRFNTPPLPPYWNTDEHADPKETQEEIRQLLKHIRPDEEISPSDPSQIQPDGLKEKLMPHQLKGVAWMKKMEEGSNKGGILADDMGLGKTIQAIALILERPRPERSRKPTLIVAPVALIEQWKREMSKMVKRSHQFNVATLHGPNARTSFSEISTYDVVMTTYGTLTSELKRQLKWEEKSKLVPDAKRTKAEQCPMLSRDSVFHRVILDEAQCIKNKNTRAAHAACKLKAEYRWCLSGTPMQNGVDEIYSLIKFCRIRPYNDLEKFNRDISRPLKARWESAKERAMQQLQALLKAILLRRTKKSEIDGEPILQLPEKHVVEDRAIFNKDEFDFYKALETQARIEFNKYLKRGTVGQNHARALVLLLRLRQCCCSPQLITNAKDFMVDSGIEGVDLLANAADLPLEVIDRLKAETDTECPICMDGVLNPIIFNPCGHTLCQDCLSRMVDNVMQEASEGVKCPHCRARIDTNKITDHESFMKVHGPEAIDPPVDDEKTESEDSDEETDDETSEDTENNDSEELADLNDFIVPDDDKFVEYENEDDDAEDKKAKTEKASNGEDVFAEAPQQKLSSKQNVPKKNMDDTALAKGKEPSSKNNKKSRKSSGKAKKKGKQKAKDAFKSLADLRKEGLRNQSAKKRYIKQLAKGYEPSAKIERTLELLQEIRDRGEGEKTIIFSSFTSFLDLLEVPLSRDDEHNNYTRYDGSMTAKDRNRAVLRFTDDPNCKVILVSIKAGNAGLNLTAANHVIILDPFWNPYVEYQAADRCYRIGQRREVTVHRVLIGEQGFDHVANPDYQFTVEDRILQLQEKKRQLVESALDEHSTSAVARLGTRELGYLFGVNDMEGRMIANRD